MKPLSLAALLAALAGPAIAGEPWEGLWAADPALCAAGGEAAERFSVSEMPGAAGAAPCAVVDLWSDYEFSYFTVTSECAGDGTSWFQVDVLMLGEGGNLWRWTGQGEPQHMTLCEET